MVSVLKKMALMGLQAAVPMTFDFMSNYIQSGIELEQERLDQEALEENIKNLNKIDKKISQKDKFKIPGIDLNTEELGRATWGKIHRSVADLPEDADPKLVKQTMANIHDMIKEYPCMDCREDGLGFANKLNLTGAKTRSEALTKSWELHNMVNEKLEKPLFSFEEFKDEYEL